MANEDLRKRARKAGATQGFFGQLNKNVEARRAAARKTAERIEQMQLNQKMYRERAEFNRVAAEKAAAATEAKAVKAAGGEGSLGDAVRLFSATFGDQANYTPSFVDSQLKRYQKTAKSPKVGGDPTPALLGGEEVPNSINKAGQEAAQFYNAGVAKVPEAAQVPGVSPEPEVTEEPYVSPFRKAPAELGVTIQANHPVTGELVNVQRNKVTGDPVWSTAVPVPTKAGSADIDVTATDIKQPISETLQQKLQSSNEALKLIGSVGKLTDVNTSSILKRLITDFSEAVNVELTAFSSLDDKEEAKARATAAAFEKELGAFEIPPESREKMAATLGRLEQDKRQLAYSMVRLNRVSGKFNGEELIAQLGLLGSRSIAKTLGVLDGMRAKVREIARNSYIDAAVSHLTTESIIKKKPISAGVIQRSISEATSLAPVNGSPRWGIFFKDERPEGMPNLLVLDSGGRIKDMK